MIVGDLAASKMGPDRGLRHLRALVKHLDGISDAAIAALNIPTGLPLVYELDDDFRPMTPGGRYLDPGGRRRGGRSRD